MVKIMTYEDYERTQIVDVVATQLDINPIGKTLEAVLTEIENKCPDAAKTIRDRKKLKDEIFHNKTNSSLFESYLNSNTGEVQHTDYEKIQEYAEKLIQSKIDLDKTVEKCRQ